MDLLDFRDPVSTWTHLIWMILALPGTVWLWQRSRGDTPKQISLGIFGVSLIVCFGSSALFHALRLSDGQLHPFITLDYVGIYLLIAGSCTPIVFTLVPGWWKWTSLASIWSVALAGISCRLVRVPIPPVLSTGLYLLMGWGLLSCFPSLAKALPPRALRLLVIGGLIYSLGAVVHMVAWPVLWAGVVGSHELLHICDMGGSLCHFCFMLWYVVPYDRLAGVPELPAVTGTLAVDQT
jgi:hemolysin III